MGYTNAVPEFQNCTTFILQDEIPHNCSVMIDDIGIKGPPTRYQDLDGNYETIPENSGIRRFIWEHAIVVSRVLHRLQHAGATISPKKSQVARSEIILAGQKLTYEGRLPDPSRVSKIVKWKPCETITQLRGFLGLSGTCRIWIENYSKEITPLRRLLQKDTPFIWDELCQKAMDYVKDAMVNATALTQIDYSSLLPVILAVDTSTVAIGFIIWIVNKENKRKPVRFGSLPLNERESRYSQPKLELYGLYRALRQCRLHLTAVKNLVVEVDAIYIKDMINHPDLQPNATLNCWIAGILLFTFHLVHVPARHHKGPDGLSRRERSADDSDEEGPEDDEDDDEWYFGFIQQLAEYTEPTYSKEDQLLSENNWFYVLQIRSFQHSEGLLHQIKDFLTTLQLPKFSNDKEKKSFLDKALHYFVKSGKLWRRSSLYPLQVILDPHKKQKIIELSHDYLGHHGIYSTYKTISIRFWWPGMLQDIKIFVQSCHPCQTRATFKIHLPPTISIPTKLFAKIYLDIMLMPKAQGYRYVVAARDNLSGAAEGCKLKKASAAAVSQFIYEEIICRYGNILEIVTDNGPETKAGTEELLRRYGINHIRISPYNSPANGVVERGHFTIREAIVKACDGNISKWLNLVHHAFFADRVTVRRATGFSPYFLLYGTDPILSLDLFEATYLTPGIEDIKTTSDLLALRIHQLQKHSLHEEQAANKLLRTRQMHRDAFIKKFANCLSQSSFKEGDLVLMRNSRVEQELDRKTKPRYLGPYKIIRQTKGGSYVVSELDGTISKRGIAAFRLIAFRPRPGMPLPNNKLPTQEEVDSDLEWIDD